MIGRLIRDESGQAATEYALIAAALVVGLFVTAKGLLALQGQVYDNQHTALKQWKAP